MSSAGEMFTYKPSVAQPLFSTQEWHWIRPYQLQPYRCPVCNGKGIVPVGFYSTGAVSTNTATDEPCRTCHGKGIVWG